jgi:hypothetical protein
LRGHQAEAHKEGPPGIQELSAMTDHVFVGIDVSKDKFDVTTIPASMHRTFCNDKRGIRTLVRELSTSVIVALAEGLVVHR